jgi:transcriptional regulator with PAS, ATPase and Fis domain
VLILGETGTGKELMAQRVHRSTRSTRGGPLIAVNCAALPGTLVESELFGHARGTFTGAHRDKKGLIEAAHGGSLFLDEVGDLPLQTQVKLLRFLDSGEYRRVGETRTRSACVRVIAATNKDTSKQVRDGLFRQDLYFRLCVFEIHIPPLRLRKEDILPLARDFLQDATNPTRATIDPDLAQWLLRYEWPGNIRELRNLCEYFKAKAWGRDHITIHDIPEHIDRSLSQSSMGPRMTSLEQQRIELERHQIKRALQATGGHIQRAAMLLGMGRNTVTRKIALYKIKVDDFSEPAEDLSKP